MKRISFALAGLTLAIIAAFVDGQTPPLPTASQTWNTNAKQLIINAINAVAKADDRVQVYAVQYLAEDNVKVIFPVLGVKVGYTIHNVPGQSLAADPNVPGAFKLDALGLEVLTDETTFKNFIRSQVPSDYVGPACFDDENAMQTAAFGDISEPATIEAIKRMATKIAWSNQARPNALWGIYGCPPRMVYTVAGNADVNAVRSLDAFYLERTRKFGVEALFPSLYKIVYPDPWTDAYEDAVDRACLELCLGTGLPTYPFVWKRYHNNGRYESGLGDTTIAPDIYAAKLFPIRDTKVNGRQCAGVMVWDNAKYFTKTLGEDLGVRPVGDHYYLFCARARSVLKSERPAGMDTLDLVDYVERYYLALTCHVLRDYPMPVEPFKLKTGPVVTEFPEPATPTHPTKPAPTTDVPTSRTPSGKGPQPRRRHRRFVDRPSPDLASGSRIA